MRRIWNLLGGEREKQPNGDKTREDESDGDEDAVEVTNTGTQTTISREEMKEEGGTRVREDRSIDEGGKRKSKKKKKVTKSSEARTPKKSSISTGKRRRSKEKDKDRSKESDKKDDEGGKRIVVAEAREIAAREDNEAFENDGGILAKSKIKTRDLQWKEESSSEERKKKGTPVKKISEARDEKKAEDEEFENEGKAPMAKSKIKTRDLKWKGSEESPQKTERSSEDKSQTKTGRKKHSSITEKVAEARDENKADDEEFENDGKATMAKSKIKTRDLKWKSNEPVGEISPGKTGSGSDSGESTEHKESRKKKKKPIVKPKVAEARDDNKADDEEFENAGSSMARSKIKTRSLKWKEEEKESPKKIVVAEAREVNRPRLSISLSRKSKTRSDKSSHSDSTLSLMTQPSRTSSTSSTRIDIAASAVDKSVKSIKSMFKKTDDTKKKMGEFLPHIERDAQDVQDARRLMEMLKRNNVFENVLFPYQNETLRAHFASGSRRLDQKTMDLLFKATDFVLDKILYRGEELDEFIDNAMKTFILNRDKARTMVVEHLLRHPEFLPQTWGGRTVVLMRSEEEVTVAPEDEKWTRSKKEGGKK